MRGVSINVGALAVIAALVTGTATAHDYLYTVRPGDTLWDLSEKYIKRGVAYTRRLQELNGVDDPEHLQPGSKLRFPIQWLKIQPAPATVNQVLGSARARTVDSEQEQALSEGHKISVGDVVITGEDGNVVVEFADGSRLLIRANSEVVFDSMSVYGDTGMADTRIRLQRGRVGVEAKPARGPGSRYEIHTPAAVSAVRGTDYRVSAEELRPAARTEVLSGIVNVAAEGRSRAVAEKFGVVAEKGTPLAPPRKLLPKPETSGFADHLERLPLEFTWESLRGARAYRVQVADTKDFGTLFVDRTVSKPEIDRIYLERDGDYYVRIRGIDAVGLEGLDAVDKLTLNARPEPPVLLQPVDQILVRSARPEFAWTEPERARAYRLQLSLDKDFISPFVDLEIERLTRFLPSEPLNPGTYFWRLATRDSQLELGPFGDPQSFTYQPPPPSPAAIPPSVTEDALNFRWSAAEGGKRYHLQIAADAQFNDILIDELQSEPAYTLHRPTPGTYYLRVATVEPDGYEGPFSAVQSADVPYEGWWKPLLFWLSIVIVVL